MRFRSVYRILTNNLGKKSLCCKWVPHILNDSHKEKRVKCSREMLDVFRRRGAKEKVVAIDEKQIYLRNVPPKECQRAWVDSAGDRPIMPRRTISDKKVLVIVASNYANSLVYFEVLQKGDSINAERYLEFLINMVAKFQERLPQWELTIQHDNTRPHIAH